MTEEDVGVINQVLDLLNVDTAITMPNFTSRSCCIYLSNRDTGDSHLFVPLYTGARQKSLICDHFLLRLPTSLSFAFQKKFT